MRCDAFAEGLATLYTQFQGVRVGPLVAGPGWVVGEAVVTSVIFND